MDIIVVSNYKLLFSFFAQAMRWIDDGKIIGPRSLLSDEDRVRIYDELASTYERDMLSIAQYQAHKLAAQCVHKYLLGEQRK